MPSSAWYILPLILSLILLCSASEPVKPEPLTVMSFNIRYGTADDGEDSWQYRKDRTAQVIKDYAPDVIGMQEVLQFQRDELLALLPRYTSFGVGRDDGVDAGEQSCVLYDKERFIVTAGGTFWLSEEPGVPGSVSWDSSMTRSCTWVRLYEPATRRGFYVFNAHFDHRGEGARYYSAALVLDRIARRELNEPAVFTGDLNCGEDSRPMTLLNKQLTDSYRVIHPDETTVGTFNGFKGDLDGKKIDYIFLSNGWLGDDGWDVLDAEIVRDSYDGMYPSDHFPVVATLRLKD